MATVNSSLTHLYLFIHQNICLCLFIASNMTAGVLSDRVLQQRLCWPEQTKLGLFQMDQQLPAAKYLGWCWPSKMDPSNRDPSNRDPSKMDPSNREPVQQGPIQQGLIQDGHSSFHRASGESSVSGCCLSEANLRLKKIKKSADLGSGLTSLNREEVGSKIRLPEKLRAQLHNHSYSEHPVLCKQLQNLLKMKQTSSPDPQGPTGPLSFWRPIPAAASGVLI